MTCLRGVSKYKDMVAAGRINWIYHTYRKNLQLRYLILEYPSLSVVLAYCFFLADFLNWKNNKFQVVYI